MLLEDEIRYYYTGCANRHGADWPPPKMRPGQWGLSFVSCKPDRFIVVRCGAQGRILTRPFWVEQATLFVNARIADGGSLRAEVRDVRGNPIEGFTLAESLPISGDSCWHVLRWKGAPDPAALKHREIRVYLEAKHTALYSIFIGSDQQARRYWEFRVPFYIPMRQEKERL